jgi:hypothetical protein
MSGAAADGMEQADSTRWVRYLVLALVAFVMLYPLLWLIGASFKSNQQIFAEVGFWPQSIDFKAYAKGWKTSTEYTFATYFLNSFLITIPRIIVTVISCVLVAYAFARFDFWQEVFVFRDGGYHDAATDRAAAAAVFGISRAGLARFVFTDDCALGFCDRYFLHIHAGAVFAQYSARYGRGCTD